MNFYINDTSVHQQFTRHTFDAGCNQFLDLVAAVKLIPTTFKIIFCKNFYLKEAIQNENIISSIKRNKDLNLRFNLIIQSVKIEYWNIQPVQNKDAQYVKDKEDFINTIVADAAESKFNGIPKEISIINFTDSKFGKSAFAINRILNNNSSSIVLNAYSDLLGFKAWLIANLISYPGLRLFEQNPKHHFNVNPNGSISRLECTINEAQKLLDSAISEDGLSTKKLYNFDTVIKKYIIFRKHESNKYHAYHENDNNKIPSKITAQFH